LVGCGEDVVAEKGEFGLDHDLVLFQERRVMTAGNANEFAAGSTTGRGDRGSRERRLIVVGNDHEEGYLHLRRMATGAVEGDPQRGSSGNELLPVRILVARIQRLVGLLRIGRRE
jgi:hypothetical protein